MEPTWAEDFPRLYELYHESDQHDEANYFARLPEELKNPYARPSYERLEEELEQLDDGAWQEFKEKVLSYITIMDSRRGYEQLFDLFMEVKGYLYLKSEGCEKIHFIPEGDTKTPDLCARCGSSTVLLEAKTINKSDEEIDWIRANSERPDGRMQAKEVRLGLGDSLKRKIADKINKAKEQLMSYACEGVQRRIVYLIIHLDILRALDPRNLGELVAYIDEQSDEQIEVMHHRI